MFVAVVAVAVLVFLTDGMRLVRQRRWRELATVGSLLALAGFLAIAASLHIPTPVDVLQRLLGPVGEALFEPK